MLSTLIMTASDTQPDTPVQEVIESAGVYFKPYGLIGPSDEFGDWGAMALLSFKNAHGKIERVEPLPENAVAFVMNAAGKTVAKYEAGIEEFKRRNLPG